MNIVVEEKPNCQVVVRVEVPADRVKTEWASVAKEFQKFAKVPGFRPGKVPASLIENRFAKDIRDEIEKNLVREGIRKAVDDNKLDLLGVSGVEEVELAPGQTMRYTATLITSPEIKLPDYKAIEVEVAPAEVTEELINSSMDRLREPHAEYDPVEGRGLAMGDFAVISFTTQLDGKPLGEVVPDAPPLLQGRQNFWIEMTSDAFVKGFCEALIGAVPDEVRAFDLTLEADFPFAALQGKSLHFEATLHAINVRKLPEWSDELAGKILANKDLASLRELVVENLKNSAEEQFERSKRSAVMEKIMSQITCELPNQLVARETAGLLREIIEENQVRGINEDEIRQHQDEILGAAKQGAEERVRSRFVLLRIAREEKLEATDQDLIGRLAEMASRYQIPIKKLITDLKKRDGIDSLREQILAAKALDFVASNVTVREPAK